MANICYFVVPCYNEEAALPKSAPVFLAKIQELIKDGEIARESKILFIDDGSRDQTWQVIENLHKENPAFTGLKLAKNAGHQKALWAGLMYAKDRADITISLDCDLQDDINAANNFIEEYKKGAQIVFGVRSKRKKDTFFKRNTALMFYNLMEKLGVSLVNNHADYRLISKQALQALAEFKESNLFIRALVPQLGFKQAKVFYERDKRVAGETKYPFKKMLSFALEGLTSFSVYPMHLISIAGILISTLSSFVFAYFFFGKIFGLIKTPGYASLICSIWLLGGLQLFAIGIIGEYIGKTYLETKRRPRYIIEKTLE